MAGPKEFRWPCSQCGAQLRFAPGQTELVCAHCGHVEQIPEQGQDRQRAALTEHDLARGLKDDLPRAAMEEVRTTTCSGCGALIEFEGANHARECPFCASPVVLDTGATRQIKPQALVPFRLDERQARQALVEWLGGLWFAPSKLLDYTRRGRAMNGIYVPYWTFDAETQSDYKGQRGDAYYETEWVTVMEDGKPKREAREVRKIRWTSVRGHVARDFDDVLVLGSNSLPPRLGNELTPWDLGALVPYSPDYLAGFTAEGYTIPLAQAEQTSKSVMAEVITRDVRSDIGGDEQRISSIDTKFSAETFKHILLPVWMAAYKYNGKSYRFLVNGQTGEVQGERPWSVWKITFAVIGAVILAGVALYAAEVSGMLDN